MNIQETNMGNINANIEEINCLVSISTEEFSIIQKGIIISVGRQMLTSNILV